jgi:2-methylcitrate dehydratase PrpD
MAAKSLLPTNHSEGSFTERLVDLLLGFPAARVSDSAVQAALRCMEDTIGVSIASAAVGTATAGARIASEYSDGAATLWGFGTRSSAPSAALANGMLAHGMDFDDTHPAAIMHASAVNVPVAIALGEELKTSPPELLAALVLSYEVSARLGRLGPGPFQDHGFQSTAVLGVFAATFLAGRLYGVDRGTVVNALGIAGSMASGLMEYLADGSNTKQLHAGWAAQSGIQALKLAAAGLTGPRTVLEGRFGVFKAFAGLSIDPEQVLQPITDRFEVELMAPKPYPACLCVHAIVQAALDLRRRGVLIPGRIHEIEAIHCEVPQWYVNLVFEPAALKAAPLTAYDGRFSASYCLARAVLDGALGIRSFEPEQLENPQVRALAGKVSYSAREFSEFPASFPALVRLRLHNGEVHESYVPHNLGSAGAPFTASDVERKFRQNVEFAIGKPSADCLHQAIVDLPRAADTGQLRATLGAARVNPCASNADPALGGNLCYAT